MDNVKTVFPLPKPVYMVGDIFTKFVFHPCWVLYLTVIHHTNIVWTSVKLMSHLPPYTRLPHPHTHTAKTKGFLLLLLLFFQVEAINIGSSLKALSHMMHEKLGSKSTHCRYTFIQFEVRKGQSLKSGKSDKNKFKNFIQTTCTSADPGKTMCKVSKRLILNCMKSCNHKVPTVYTFEVRKWQSSQSTKKW